MLKNYFCISFTDSLRTVGRSGSSSTRHLKGCQSDLDASTWACKLITSGPDHMSATVFKRCCLMSGSQVVLVASCQKPWLEDKNHILVMGSVMVPGV